MFRLLLLVSLIFAISSISAHPVHPTEINYRRKRAATTTRSIDEWCQFGGSAIASTALGILTGIACHPFGFVGEMICHFYGHHDDRLREWLKGTNCTLEIDKPYYPPQKVKNCGFRARLHGSVGGSALGALVCLPIGLSGVCSSLASGLLGDYFAEGIRDNYCAHLEDPEKSRTKEKCIEDSGNVGTIVGGSIGSALCSVIPVPFLSPACVATGILIGHQIGKDVGENFACLPEPGYIVTIPPTVPGGDPIYVIHWRIDLPLPDKFPTPYPLPPNALTTIIYYQYITPGK